MNWWKRFVAWFAVPDPLDVDDRMQGTQPMPKSMRVPGQDTQRRMLDEVPDNGPDTIPVPPRKE